MWSVSGSALLPNSVTTVPFTFTWPALINSSALRREAIPAAAMIFCRRSAGMFIKLPVVSCRSPVTASLAAGNRPLATVLWLLFMRGGFRDLFRMGSAVVLRRFFRRNQLALKRLRHQFLELLHAGQLADVLQAEAHQEFPGGLVENRPPDHLLAAGGRNQFAIEQRSDHSTGIHAANLVDLRHRRGLFISDHSQRFQGRQRQSDGRL